MEQLNLQKKKRERENGWRISDLMLEEKNTILGISHIPTKENQVYGSSRNTQLRYQTFPLEMLPLS